LDAEHRKSALLLHRIPTHSTFYPFSATTLRQKAIFSPVT
jgi:hypothetical protein